MTALNPRNSLIKFLSSMMTNGVKTKICIIFTQQVIVHSDDFRIDLIITTPKETATGLKHNIDNANKLSSTVLSDSLLPPRMTSDTAENAQQRTIN